MMNMMTGAVAINGGVGVMEVRQPQVAVSQMAASAAQAAEQVALNAHITLRELKGMIDTVVEKKLPTFKTLMEMNPVAVARTSVNGAKLTAYENGYAVYEVDSAHTSWPWIAAEITATISPMAHTRSCRQRPSRMPSGACAF